MEHLEQFGEGQARLGVDQPRTGYSYGIPVQDGAELTWPRFQEGEMLGCLSHGDVTGPGRFHPADASDHNVAVAVKLGAHQLGDLG
jgi:hypothetical protein